MLLSANRMSYHRSSACVTLAGMELDEYDREIVFSPAPAVFFGPVMAKSKDLVDVLVLGEHPCAYLAADLLAAKPPLRVVHCTIPDERVADRLVLINPQLFALHKPLEKLRKKLSLTGICGLDLLADDGATRGEYRCKTPAALVGSYAQVRKALCQQARESGVKLLTPKSLAIRRVDEKGLEVAADAHVLHPSAILLAGTLPPDQARTLALPDAFSPDVMKRYSFVRLRGHRWYEPSAKPVACMSLDLGKSLTWAWMLPGDEEMQLAVEHAPENDPAERIRRWAEVLRSHGMIKTTDGVEAEPVISLDIPAGGALTREVVANRTLLFGPAGGFYSACLEDIYPNCWSAVFAADAIRTALPQPHLQDALQPYREKWGTTLGEYLRGPQQNLRFLLPLVYRNPVMTARMAESILQGKSVVR